MSDGHRPHQYPRNAPAEVLAWRCGACGEIIREFGSDPATACPVDWRSAAQPLNRMADPI